jgi:hypothetical protein
LASDGGRVCRPLVIADKGISRVKAHHMKELKVIISYAFILKIKMNVVYANINSNVLSGWRVHI